PMLNWHLKPKELAQCINAAQPKALLFDSEFLDSIVQIRGDIPSVQSFIIVGAVQTPEGMIAYEDLLSRSGTELPPGHLDMAARPYSGGTTGTPKFMNINRERLASDDDKVRRGAPKDELVRYGLMHLRALYYYKLGQLRDPVTQNVRSLIPGPLY